jgi:hypothetical protein
VRLYGFGRGRHAHGLYGCVRRHILRGYCGARRPACAAAAERTACAPDRRLCRRKLFHIDRVGRRSPCLAVPRRSGFRWESGSRSWAPDNPSTASWDRPSHSRVRASRSESSHSSNRYPKQTHARHDASKGGDYELFQVWALGASAARGEPHAGGAHLVGPRPGERAALTRSRQLKDSMPVRFREAVNRLNNISRPGDS